jgi:adenine-specific DNA-methyltransferase
VEEDGYEMRWVGKREAYHTAFLPTQKILNPLIEDSKNWDSTGNLLLRGDNLEALRLLRHSYFGKIKLIYIDPPYNTKSDAFIYNDDFSTKQTQILAELGYDKDNIDYIKNIYGAKTHSGWLSFMYPRLLLAKDLLRDDGVIFISIDDNEQAQLKLLCDEVFGEENFEGHIHWRRRHNQPNDKTKMIGLVAEHVLSYSKNKELFKQSGVGKVDLTGSFSNPDNDPRGDWASKPWKVGSDQSGSRYTLKNPINNQEYDEEWMGEESTYISLLNDNRIIFPRNGNGLPRKKYFRFEREEEGQCAVNWWGHEVFGHNQGANDVMTTLFGIKNVFSNPKPIDLIRGFIQLSNAKNGDIVLDFFAGSGSTGHAVMEYNLNDKADLKFILVQIPQAIDPQKQKEAYRFVTEDLNKPATIFEITAERLRRAGQKIDVESAVDTGFRVFDIIEDTDALILQKPLSEVTQADLNIFIQHNTDSDNRERVLYNLLLSEGLPLTTVIKELIADTVYLADDVALILGAVDLTLLTDTLKALSHSATPAVYLTVYAPWVRDDNFMLGLKTLAESLGFSSDKLRLRG